MKPFWTDGKQSLTWLELGMLWVTAMVIVMSIAFAYGGLMRASSAPLATNAAVPTR